MQGDCLERMKELEDNSVDSIVTDPPYAFAGGFMGKDWTSVQQIITRLYLTLRKSFADLLDKSNIAWYNVVVLLIINT